MLNEDIARQSSNAEMSPKMVNKTQQGSCGVNAKWPFFNCNDPKSCFSIQVKIYRRNRIASRACHPMQLQYIVLTLLAYQVVGEE